MQRSSISRRVLCLHRGGVSRLEAGDGSADESVDPGPDRVLVERLTVTRGKICVGRCHLVQEALIADAMMPHVVLAPSVDGIPIGPVDTAAVQALVVPALLGLESPGLESFVVRRIHTHRQKVDLRDDLRRDLGEALQLSRTLPFRTPEPCLTTSASLLAPLLESWGCLGEIHPATEIAEDLARAVALPFVDVVGSEPFEHGAVQPETLLALSGQLLVGSHVSSLCSRPLPRHPINQLPPSNP